MALQVKLPVFEGPLDLLLHLIEKNKIDIYDIPVSSITDQYLESIRQMELQDMNVASEFLVMAATLLEIKCRMLLPKGPEGEEEEDEDPREELVQRLLEYKMYKYISYELKDMRTQAGRSFFRGRSMPPEVETFSPPPDYEMLLGGATLSDLSRMMKEALRRSRERVDPVRGGFRKIEKEEINLEDKISHVASAVRSRGRVSFRELLEKQHSRMEVIVTFLAVLELARAGQATLEQTDIDGGIVLCAKPEQPPQGK